MQHPPDVVVGHADQARDVCHQQYGRRRHHVWLPTASKSPNRQPATHRHPSLLGITAMRAPRAAPSSDDSLVLENVQVVPSARLPVVPRLLRRPAGRKGQPTGRARHLKVGRDLVQTKQHAVYHPRRCQPQGQGEKLFLHRASLAVSGPAFQSRRDEPD